MMNHGFFRKIVFCFSILLCFCICSSSFVAMASDNSLEETHTVTSETTEYQDESYSESVSTTVTRVSASDSNGFKAVILGLFGDYEMITKEYTYTSNNGYTTKQVTTESDYPWMISAAIFVVFLYCCFRLLGGVICGRK